MKTIFAALLCLFCSFLVHSQTRLSGKILDFATGKPVDYATVTIADKKTDKVVDGATADSTGGFVIKGLAAGTYKVSVFFIGYDTYTADSVTLNTPQFALPIIRLHSSAHTLKDVVVTGNAPIIENKIDKIVYNAANDLTAQGGVALDVLKKVPQVSVDVDGNVELQGNSNIRFLINGKPSSIFGNSLADALASIPASQIKSIEAITSPGAKYDAQGTGGIINIILKDNKVKGVNGSVDLSAGTRLENGSLNLNIRRSKFGINAFVSGNASLKSKTPSTQDRTSYNAADQTTTRLLQDGYTNVARHGYESGISFDWDMSKKDVLTGGVQYNDFNADRDGIMSQQETTYDAMNNMLAQTSILRHSTSGNTSNSFDWNLGYKHKFKHEGEELEVNYNSSYGRPLLQYTQDQWLASATGPYAGNASYNPGTDNSTNISVDYTRPITEKTIIEAGAKSSFNNINSVTDVSTLIPSNGEYQKDVLQSYSLNYKMNVYAGYLSASFPLFKFLDVKAGFRVEHTDVGIGYANTHIPSYNTYVPSVTLSHKINERQFVKLSYSHRIERPEYDELNPFLNLSDPYNINTGNPLLKPEIGDNMELGYNRSFDNGANFYVAISERINSHDIKPFTTFYPDYTIGDSVYHNVSITDRQNIGTEYNSGLIITGSAPIIKKLNLRGNLNIFNRHIVNNVDPVNPITNSLTCRLNMNLSYELPHDLAIEAFGNYRSPWRNIQGKNPQQLGYTIAARKQFWNKKASVGITATNFLSNYLKQVSTISTSAYESYSVREVPVRSFGVTFSYKFGKLDFKEKKRDNNFMDNQGDN